MYSNTMLKPKSTFDTNTNYCQIIQPLETQIYEQTDSIDVLVLLGLVYLRIYGEKRKERQKQKKTKEGSLTADK